MSTKSNKSSGTQHTQRGVNQGVVLVDPKTGLPINVVDDAGVKKLSVDANFSIDNATVNVDLDYETDSVSIGDPTTDARLRVNPDGSIDSNVEIDAADGDNVAVVGTEDGTLSGTQHTLKIGSDKNARVLDEAANSKLQNISDNTDQIESKLDAVLTELQQKTEPSDTQQISGSVSISGALPLPTGAATESTLTQVFQSVDQVETKLDAILTEIAQKTEPSDAQNIRSLDSNIDSVSVPGIATATKQDEAKAVLQSIDSKLTNPLPVSVPSGVTIGDLSANKDDVAIAGTENGTATGTVRHFVNNRRLQILAAHDRDQAITYADFGTKDQRVTQIVYTSATFPGNQAIKTITYTLIGNRYRRDNITWSLV